MRPKDADRMANSVDPDQTAPLGSTLFAQTCLSENLGSLRYLVYDLQKFLYLIWAAARQSQQDDMCAQQSLRSARTDQSLCCALSG